MEGDAVKKEKLEYLSYLIITIIGGGLLLFVFVRNILIWLMPFLIAWGIAFAVRGPSRLIRRKTKIPERLVRVALSLLCVLGIISVGGIFLWQLVGAVWRFLSEIGEGDALYSFFEVIINPGAGIFGNSSVPSELAEQLDQAFKAAISAILSNIATAVTEWAGLIPRIIVFIIITVIATVYFAFGLETVNSAIKRILPKSVFSTLVKIKNGFISVGVRYVRSYSLIMLITFVIMLAGFMLLKIEYAPLLALIVAALDVLPLFGVGTMLVPWSIYQFIVGNKAVAIGLLVLLLINEVIRQFTEPKIIGKNLNMHPILTLFLLYVGYGLFGIVGLVILPFSAVVANILGKKSDSEEIKGEN